MNIYKVNAEPMDGGQYWFTVKADNGGTEKQPYGIITRQELKDLINRLQIALDGNSPTES